MPKKKTIDLGFTPSPYQEKIFDFIQHGVGNAVIKACAGSAKTTTAVASMKLIPRSKKCLFIAFNKAIVEDLVKKLDGYNNCTVKTIHSLGYMMVRRNLGADIEIDEYKYRTYIKSNINELTSIEDGQKMTRQMVQEYIDSISMLVDYSRFNLAQSVREIEEVAIKYSIPVTFDECEVALKCLQWGKENYKTIDYTDMVWLPYELSLKPIGLQFDWIFLDEAQDASKMSVELFLRCFKRGTRFVSVGDKNQSIYFFAGSSLEAFDYMCEYPNTSVFDLPISYRCGKNITKFANNIVPEMQYRENANEGIVATNCKISEISDGDMVLARSKAPLLTLYIKLLRRGVNCYIKGQDIGSNLIKMLEEVDIDELNADLRKDGVFTRLYDNMFNERNKLIERRGLDLNDATLSVNVMNMYDSINSLIILAERYNSKTELVQHIKDIFKDEANGVCLSTIHKAKGLEAENVYILCHSMMPSKLAQHDWEKEQERNLQYVAYTRAKNKLGFISEKEVPPSGSMLDPNEILTELKYIENKVCKALGKEPLQFVDNVEMAKFNLRNATKIEDFHKNDNYIEINARNTDNVNDKTDEDLLKQLMTFMENGGSNAVEKVKDVISKAEKNRGN